jgi:putative DNA primase/helicase
LSLHENYQDVLHQMGQFGIELRDRDLPLTIDHPKKKTCGKGGKAWYWLRTFTLDSGRSYIVGAFGSYKTGGRQKVEVDWAPLSDAERARRAQERSAAQERAEQARREEVALAALSARDLWNRGAPTGRSAYLEAKGVEAEACRYLRDGSILVPLIRYDFERDQALRGVQRIFGAPRYDRDTGEPLPGKTFTKGFDKPGCAVRLGAVVAGAPVLLCEGYATGLTLRMAVARRWPVYVGLDGGNLLQVAYIVRSLHVESPLLLCADDDWRTTDHAGDPDNVGRRYADEVRRRVDDVHVIYPVFGPNRGDKDTDFNDLHARAGLATVRAQLLRALAFLRPDEDDEAA